MTSIAINGDCVTGMRRYPDNYFDLAVVDPPYGGGGTAPATAENALGDCLTDTRKIARTGGKWAAKYGKKL